MNLQSHYRVSTENVSTENVKGRGTQTGLRVITAGINTQIQDIGRKGYLFSGVSNSGFLDARAAYTANRLCGNPVGVSLLEIPWGGFKCISMVDNLLSVCGAQSDLFINGTRADTWRSHYIRQGDELSITSPSSGVWCYLAIRGGFQMTPVLGSVSGNSREKLGGLTGDGSKVLTGDVLPCLSSRNSQCLTVSARPVVPLQSEELTLRMIPGAQFHKLTRIQKRSIFSSCFELSKDYNRMGYRLSCQNSVLTQLPKITPDAIAYGAVQIPPSGQPIVLLNDRQTLGGYCKPGSVISPDCHQLVQSRPGQKIRFELIRPITGQKLVKFYWMQLIEQPLREI